MDSALKRMVLNILSYSDRISTSILRRISKPLEKQLSDNLTDHFIGILLNGMDMAFGLSRDYRKNIKNFNGRYLFCTYNGAVGVATTFANGKMSVITEPPSAWEYTVRVTFKDSRAIKEFLYSQNQDILQSILRNDVKVDGNLNYIYKFGFMARDLLRRLGIE